jgi:enhancing lycopene biosynthesis protein 2
MAPKVGVVLSGCGYLDGSEIHEAVLALYFLDRAGAEIHCFAPDRDQFHVINHLTGEPTGEVRNVLVESARIARGAVRDLREADMDSLDALVLPGGYGAAKNLSDFAFRGTQCEVDPDLARILSSAVAAKKPILAICISPAVLAAALRRMGSHAVSLTIGDDVETARAIESLGCRHVPCSVDRVVVDEQHRIISTPAYMLGPGPGEVGAGIKEGVRRLLSWLGARSP